MGEEPDGREDELPVAFRGHVDDTTLAEVLETLQVAWKDDDDDVLLAATVVVHTMDRRGETSSRPMVIRRPSVDTPHEVFAARAIEPLMIVAYRGIRDGRV